MKSIHLVIPDLFLPEGIATEVCVDLRLPALEKMLGRGASTKPLVLSAVEGSARTGDVYTSLENHLCELFGVTCAADAPIAAISATFDGLGEGCWLRADPVHLGLQRDQLLLVSVQPSGDEAGQMCASLNEHFAGQGMEFFAPHPQRWYVRLDALPRIRTTPFSVVLGSNVRRALPSGEDAAHWHRLINEIQMLLFAHPLNEAREGRGELAINSVWIWGGGCNFNSGMTAGWERPPGRDSTHRGQEAAPTNVSSDDVLSEMFAAAAGVPFLAWPERWNDTLSLAPLRAPRAWLHPRTAAAARGMPHATPPPPQRERGRSSGGRQLLVWTGLRTALQRGDLAAWRAALQDFETGYAQPLWQALRSGELGQLQLDILGEHGMRRVQLKRCDTWAVWRRGRRLAEYSLV